MAKRGLRLRSSQSLRQDTSAQDLLVFQLRALGLQFETEYRFAKDFGREWEWDIAFPAVKVAVEVDGGIWVKGAHGHPITILRNMDKRNWGAALGWRVLAFPTDAIKGGVPLAFIEAVVNGYMLPMPAPVRSRK